MLFFATQWTNRNQVFFLFLNMFHHGFQKWWTSWIQKIDHSCIKLVLIMINWKNMFFFTKMLKLWSNLFWDFKESPCSKMLLCNYYAIYVVNKYVIQVNSWKKSCFKFKKFYLCVKPRGTFFRKKGNISAWKGHFTDYS